MADIESHIAGSQKLIEAHGGWPSFHDAEVIELHFWRGYMNPKANWDDRNVLPTLTAKIHIMIERPTTLHTLATLRFEDVDEFRMEGFNHQNAIYGLLIRIQESDKLTKGEALPPYMEVQFQAASGMDASFRCSRIEVIDAVRCKEDGNTCA
jgi:hypothetical protein